VRLRAELQEQLGITPEIRPGWPTQFIVSADGEIVFSRRGERRMPRPGEVAERLRGAGAGTSTQEVR
jgi:hypothetical protein